MPNSTRSFRARGPALGLGAIAAAALLWAVAAAMASELFDAGVPPLELAEARALIAAAGLALVWALRGRAEDRRPLVERAGLSIALGLAIALVNASYYVAIDHLAVAVAVVVQYIAPVLVVTYIALQARRMPSSDIVLALTGAVTGVVFVSEVPSKGVGDVDAVGISAALASAALFAIYTLLSERSASRFGTMSAMFRAFVAAATFWVIWQIPRGWPEELTRADNLPKVVFVGVAGTLAPFLLYVWGTQHVRAERASIAATLEPVLAAVVAWIWLSETLSPLQIVGGALVLASLLSLQVRRRRALRAVEP